MRRVLLSHGLLGVAAAHPGSPLPRPLGGVAERWRLRGVAQGTGTGTGTGSASLLSWPGAFTPLARLPSLLRLSPHVTQGRGWGRGLGGARGGLATSLLSSGPWPALPVTTSTCWLGFSMYRIGECGVCVSGVEGPARLVAAWGGMGTRDGVEGDSPTAMSRGHWTKLLAEQAGGQAPSPVGEPPPSISVAGSART